MSCARLDRLQREQQKCANILGFRWGEKKKPKCATICPRGRWLSLRTGKQSHLPTGLGAHVGEELHLDAPRVRASDGHVKEHDGVGSHRLARVPLYFVSHFVLPKAPSFRVLNGTSGVGRRGAVALRRSTWFARSCIEESQHAKQQRFVL